MKLYAPITIATSGSPEGTLSTTNVGTSLDPAAWSSSTTYALGARVTVSETIYQSLIASNTNNPPATSPTQWGKVGSINKLALFDSRVSTQTTNPDSITGSIALNGVIVDTISVINCDAASITITQVDATDGTVYSQTQTMDENVGDWWEYLYFPILRKTAALFTGLLPYRSSTITYAFSNPGATTKVGRLAMGQAVEPGDAQWGASDGIQDYSVIREDAFGIRDIVERDYADDADFNVWVPDDESPRFRRVLAERRAKETVFILADSRPDAQYVGIPSFKRAIAYPGMDVFTVTVKGFT